MLLAALLALLSVPLGVDSYAATPSSARRKASSSDALRDALAELNGISEGDFDEYTLEDFDFVDLLELLGSYVSGPGVDYQEEPQVEDLPDDIIPYVPDQDGLEGGIEALAVLDGDAVVNAVRYRVRVNGSVYTLLLPSDSVDKVYIDGSGYLWNMSTSVVSGRLFTGNFNPASNTGVILYLGACLGNNFTANNNYGSPNYMRSYYWSSGSLRYTDTYVTVLVEEQGFPFYSSQTLLYIGLIILGGILICLWRKSLH